MVVDTCRVPTLGVATGDAKVVRVGGNEVARVVDVLEANEVHVEEASEEIIADRETILKLSGEGNNEWRKDPMPARGHLRLRKVGSLNKIQGTRER